MRAAAMIAGALMLAILVAPRAPASVGVVHAQEMGPAGFSVLVFSRTREFRHDSIPAALTSLRRLGAERGFGVDATEDPSVFTDAGLAPYRVVVFLMTTGDVLDADAQAAFERFIRAGNGFVGIHSATDTEYDWPWYGGLVGAYFARHPEIQPAAIQVEDPTHVSTEILPERWERSDEWYDFQTNPRLDPGIRILASLDEATYTGGGMGDHPIAWYHEYDGGRAWYTGGGHTADSYAEPLFVRHVWGGIAYAAGY